MCFAYKAVIIGTKIAVTTTHVATNAVADAATGSKYWINLCN